jgi:hypothetical protein
MFYEPKTIIEQQLTNITGVFPNMATALRANPPIYYFEQNFTFLPLLQNMPIVYIDDLRYVKENIIRDELQYNDCTRFRMSQFSGIDSRWGAMIMSNTST